MSEAPILDFFTVLTPYFDGPFAVVAAVAIVAAAFRAFTGFGANVIWGPVLMVFYGPVDMVAIMAVAACATMPQIAIPAAKDADWPTMWVMFAAVIVAVPVGVVTLLHADPLIVKKAFGVFILICALILASGWVYRGTHSRWATAGTGALAGWIGGFAGVGGPVLVIYFMAAPGEARVQRANNTISVSLIAPVTLAALIWQGAITPDAWIRGALLLIPMAFGQWIGLRLFRIAPVKLFRRVSLGLMMAIGISVLLA